jgi:acyl-phosphate glycerol 3-phosphate acyltransferase
MKLALLILFAYMLGSVPFGLVLTRIFASADIRRQGSGNIGATNVRRVAGWKLGILTLIADMAKGAIPVWLAMTILPENSFRISVVALSAFSGHLYPIYLKFRDGGKGVATAAGIFMMISPKSFTIAIPIFMAIVLLTRRVSAGSLLAAVALMISVPIFTKSAVFAVCAMLITAGIWIRHRDNIRRLFSGRESAIFMILMYLIFPTNINASPVMDEDVQVYLQAINEIERYSLDNITRRDILSKSLKAYLKITDPFSAYLTPEEYDLFKYIGLGIEFDTDNLGRIVCFPYPEGAADKAGILPGDILEALDGEDVRELSPLMVTAKSLGKENSEAELKVVRKDRHSDFRAKRIAAPQASLRLETYTEFAWIRFLAFTSHTRQELQKILSEIEPTSPIILDLRGNPGGDLYAATDCATLFLEKDKTIVGFKSRAETKLYKNMTIPMNAKSPVYIWQDEGSAGASEVFIAAMADNGRAQSLGKKTSGKGIRQDIIELADGSALFITTAWLQTPDGDIFHNKGLEPTYPIEGQRIGTDQYRAKFCDLILPKLLENAPTLQKTSVSPPAPVPDKIRITQLSWSVRFGLYSTADAAITAFKSAKAKKASKTLRFWVQISGYKNEADAQKDVKKFQKEGIEAHPDIEASQDTSVRYGVMIGFYPRRDDKLFNSFKKDGIIGTDAYWIQVREN